LHETPEYVILASAGLSIFKTFYVFPYEGRPSCLSSRRDPVLYGQRKQNGFERL
jgi:hypothetical protein